MSHSLPDAFRQRISQQLGSTADNFFQSLQEPAPVSLRINKEKIIDPQPGWQPVPWCGHAFYLPERPDFTADPLLHAGCYYVQEASSMFLAHVLQQVINPNTPLKALDLCAAPGGKSTLLLDVLPANSLLLSNEVIKIRASILRENLSKWGRSGVLVSNSDPKAFENLPGFFDVVLVDAPCSGEGMFRKDAKAMTEWSPEHVQLCAARQQRILQHISGCVKPGGLLIYSTCTFSPDENENQVQQLLQSGEWKSVEIAIDSAWNIEQVKQDNLFAFRFYPHRNRGEGLFISCLRRLGADTQNTQQTNKNYPVPTLPAKQRPLLDSWLRPHHHHEILLMKDTLVAFPAHWMADYVTLNKQVHIIQTGVELGKLMGNDLIPAHELALSNIKNPELPVIELDRTQAQLYLKKGNVQLQPHWPRGWVLVQYQGQTLGWAKVLDRRLNNYYPTNWRILKDLDQ